MENEQMTVNTQSENVNRLYIIYAQMVIERFNDYRCECDMNDRQSDLQEAQEYVWQRMREMQGVGWNGPFYLSDYFGEENAKALSDGMVFEMFEATLDA